MSWWDSLKANVEYGIQSVNNAYNDAVSFPTQSECPTCHAVTIVSPSAFNWVCFNNHTNHGTSTICHQCPVTKQEVRARGLYKPSVTCHQCHRLNELYETKAMNWSATQVQNAPSNAAKLANNVKTQVVTLASAPTTFHCTNCSTELGLPMGPWTCSACNLHNTEQTTSCAHHPCNHSRYHDPIICGICQQYTTIPQRKITDHLQKLGGQITSVSRGQYLKLWAQEPYCYCGTCQTPVVLTQQEFDQIGPKDQHAPQHNQQQQQPPPVASESPYQAPNLYPTIPQDQQQHAQKYQPTAIDGTPLQASAPGIDQQLPSVSITCPKCQQQTIVNEKNLVFKKGKGPSNQHGGEQQPQQTTSTTHTQQPQAQPQVTANPYASTNPYQHAQHAQHAPNPTSTHSYGYGQGDERREKLLDDDRPPEYSNQ